MADVLHSGAQAAATTSERCSSNRSTSSATVDQTRDFTYVVDVVAGLRIAGRTPGIEGGVFNFGGGSQASVNDALALIRGLAGRELAVSYGEAPGAVRAQGPPLVRPQLRVGGFAPATAQAHA
jgi:nucleoside-diphosphate-sugar epimerase